LLQSTIITYNPKVIPRPAAEADVLKMSSWLPQIADILVASAQGGDSDPIGQLSKSRRPFCHSPEGYSPFSKLRQFDFTPCFEHLVVLPIPLVLLLVAGIIDVSRIGKKGPRRRRGGWSKARLVMKMVCHLSTDS
jgi:hypothetical protein